MDGWGRGGLILIILANFFVNGREVATSMMPLIAIKDIREVKTNGKKIILHLTNGQEVSSSNELFYLGKAGEYHFFFNSTKNKSKTIRNSDVSSIEKLNQ